MILRQGDFYIDGKKGKENLHAVLENYPTISIPKRKKNLTSIEGGNEQVILDDGSYENREIDLSIIIHADDEESRTLRVSALVSAFDSADYIRFVHYGEPDYEYEITNADVITSTRLTRVSFYTQLKLKLSAKAFKYYKPEENFFVTSSYPILNKFSYSSRPLIHFTSSGNQSITINGSTSVFNNLPSGGAWVDCEESQQDVYKNDNTLVNNAFRVSQEFPLIPPGKVTITASQVMVYPRWRTI